MKFVKCLKIKLCIVHFILKTVSPLAKNYDKKNFSRLFEIAYQLLMRHSLYLAQWMNSNAFSFWTWSNSASSSYKDVYIINKIRRGAWLLDISRVSAANELDIELSTRRGIPYLRATMYYSLFILFLKLSHCLSFFLFNCPKRVNVLLLCVCLGELVIPDNANVYYALNSSMEPLLFKLKKKAAGQSSWGLCSPFWSFFCKQLCYENSISSELTKIKLRKKDKEDDVSSVSPLSTSC